MQVGANLWLLTLLPGHASLTGTWALKRIKSDFGAADAPRQFVLYVEQTRSHLTVTTISADNSAQRVSYRECRIETSLSGAVMCLMSNGVDETWQVTSTDELTITR